MRRRVLLIAFAASVCVTIASIALGFASEPADHPRQPASDLSLSFLGYSNGLAVVQVKNQGKEKVQLAYGYIEVEFRNPTNGSVFFSGEAYPVSSSHVLASGALFRDLFPPPANGFCWRAMLAAFDGRELKRKQAVEGSWFWRHRPSYVVKRYPELAVAHADTEWIAP